MMLIRLCRVPLLVTKDPKRLSSDSKDLINLPLARMRTEHLSGSVALLKARKTSFKRLQTPTRFENKHA